MDKLVDYRDKLVGVLVNVLVTPIFEELLCVNTAHGPSRTS